MYVFLNEIGKYRPTYDAFGYFHPRRFSDGYVTQSNIITIIVIVSNLHTSGVHKSSKKPRSNLKILGIIRVT
jgi:hypothetical protein